MSRTTAFSEEEGGVSPMQSPVHTTSGECSESELLRALMDTVWDLSTAVAQTNVQQARTTQQMQALSDFLVI